MLGRMCLGAMLIGWQWTKLTHHSMSYILLLSRPVLSRPLSSETLVWLLSAVTYSDSLITSQAEVPLEWIHAFCWEMGPFTCLGVERPEWMSLLSRVMGVTLHEVLKQ